jgi:hypothetical protein
MPGNKKKMMPKKAMMEYGSKKAGKKAMPKKKK